MNPQVIADEARRRSEEAVRRIREESGRRVLRARHRSCFSWCMLASLAGGLSLAVMDAYDARVPERPEQGLAEREAAYDARLRLRVEQAAAKEETRRARVAAACARRDAVLAEIDRDGYNRLKGSRTEAEALIGLVGATAAGCDQPVP